MKSQDTWVYVGDDYEQRPASFAFEIYNHVKFVDPAKYGVDDKGVDPQYYFVTSGDAVHKTVAMQRDLRNHIKQWQGKKRYALALRKSLKDVDRLLKLLCKIRGDDIFLETEYINRVLTVTPKNPRTKVA
jgi:hypothetical protein